jgi:hypothetical protein
MKRILLLGLVLAVGLLGLSSCNTDGSGAGSMAGTWTLNSTQTAAGDVLLGDGSFSLSYVGEFNVLLTFELYTGTGTIGGVDYSVDLTYLPTFQSVSISIYVPPEDPEFDSIDLEDSSYTGGTTLDGTYTGSGKYATSGTDIGEGTFIATQN